MTDDRQPKESRARGSKLDGLMHNAELVARAKEIDPGAWSLNGDDLRRRQAVWRAYLERRETDR